MDHTPNTANFRAAFLLVLVLVVSVLFIAVVWLFLKPLLLAALFAGLSHPFYKWVRRVLGQRHSLAALVTLLVLFILVAGPLSAFVGLAIKQAISMSDHVIPGFNNTLVRRVASMRTIGWCNAFLILLITFLLRSSWWRMLALRRSQRRDFS